MSEHTEGLEGIAIIGMAGRFPGAPDLDRFWHNLCAGVESIRFYPDEELLAAGIPAETLANPAYVKANAALDGVELFDAAFFGINPNIAEITDPQQRVFLEVAWHALEHAGHDAERFSGDIGVFAGLSVNTYLIENLATHRRLIESQGLLQAAMANRGDHLATLTAYKLGLRGPAFTVQSTCSTALSAVHLGCQALLGHQTDMVLAGGISIRVPQTMGYWFQEGGVASPDGHCRPFDARARGTVFGSGAGVVVLRRLEDALRDGDTIHAVILGTAANNDGAAKIGYTAPSSEGQRKVIRMAQAVAGVSPDTIGLVECHGTGTVLGDPIEVEALARVFASRNRGPGSCALGSVKSNVGHLDTAAGIAGLIKATLCLAHRQIPPTLHFETPNPELELGRTPFYVNRTLQPFPAGAGHPRRAGVSAFGIGGTNVHVVLEEAPATQRAGASVAEDARWVPLLLSARTASALEDKTAALLAHLQAHPGVDLADVAHTLHVGRKRFARRRAFACRSVADAIDVLQRLPPERVYTAQPVTGTPALGFLFPGLAGLRPGLGRVLYPELPDFRAHADACLQTLQAELGLDLGRLLFPAADAAAADAALAATQVAEPALFVLQYALSQCLIAAGVRPQAVLGEGVGEYAAACVAGAISLADAAILLAWRSRHLSRAQAGGVALVGLSAAALEGPLAQHGLSLAMVGRASLCAVAGSDAALAALEAAIVPEGVAFRRLPGDRALQTPALAAAGPELAAALRRIRFEEPKIPWISGVTGRPQTARTAAAPSYWTAQLSQPLQVSEGLTQLYADPDRILLEVGGGRTLTNIARLHAAKAPHQVAVAALPDDDPDLPETGAWAKALARLWTLGVDLNRLHPKAAAPRRVPLPLYPFERQRYWLESRPAAPSEHVAETPSVPRKPDLADWFYVPGWKRAVLAPAAKAPASPETVLFLLDGLGIGEQVADAFAAQGHAVLRVTAQDSYRALGGGRYAIDPLRPEDYRQLLQDLTAAGWVPARIIHLWALAPRRAHSGHAGANGDPAIALGTKSLLWLAQALGAARLGEGVTLQVVTSEVCEVLGEERLSPEKATILGPALVLGQEYQNLRCRVIDVVLPVPGSAEETALAEHLAIELLSNDSEPVLAYRGRHRWVKRHEPVRLAPPAGLPRLVRERGVYLITGGLGGMGLVFADWLARTASARLVLIGRTALPEPSRWEAILADPAQADTAAVIQQIQAWESLGAQVMTVACDVSDRAAMATALAEARARFGRPNGVIHAAGVPASGAIQRKTSDMVDAVLAPKLGGARVLDALLGGERLDFVVHCSSRTAVLGGFGQADYAAANTFLDAHAHERSRSRATPTLSIGWCGWQEVGMLARTARPAGSGVRPEALAALGAASLQPAPPEPTVIERPLRQPHPLLAQRLPRPAGQLAYETTLRAETHWVLADHRILGTPVVSGTTYLEMIRAALDGGAPGEMLELSEIYFFTPLAVRLGEERVARMEIEAVQGGYDFRVQSRVPGAPEASALKHMTGKARRAARGPDTRHDLAAIRARCPRVQTFTDADARDEDHGARWQCFRQVRYGDGEILATLELPPEHAADLPVMALHPAMLDKAISTGRDFILGKVPYMPYSYGQLRFLHPLPQRIQVHTRSRGEASQRGETPSFDVVILDDTGLELVRVDGFSLKRVNDVAAVYRGLAEREAQARAAAVTEAPAKENVFGRIMREEGITPAEGVRVLGCLLDGPPAPHVVISTRDLEALRSRGTIYTAPAQAGALTDQLEARPRRPSRPRPALGTSFRPPATPVEQAVAELWCDALSLDSVGVDDSFFDLGGDSVVAIQIASRLKQRLGQEVEVVQLFEAPTIAALARLLGNAAVPAPGASLAATDAHTVQPGTPFAATDAHTVQPGTPFAATDAHTVQPGTPFAAADAHTVQPGRPFAATDAHTVQPGRPFAAADAHTVQTGRPFAAADAHTVQTGTSLAATDAHAVQTGTSFAAAETSSRVTAGRPAAAGTAGAIQAAGTRGARRLARAVARRQDPAADDPDSQE